jgi:predicted O-methyltransferase YrrM|tara:strand:+ start:4105 stop:4767 length:663 start_codon:yes stop_codon:yes gene_type:complete
LSKNTIQLDDHLYEYLLDVSLREHNALRSLRDETLSLSGSQMQISPDQGQFMAFMVRAIRASNILEIGTYTGYSALVCALAMKNGRLITLDRDPVMTGVAEKYWKLAKVDHLIEHMLGTAMDSLNHLVSTEQNLGSFDMIFIDADKRNYHAYYELCLQLISKDGIILFDNVLWSGDVADPNNEEKETIALRELNQFLHGDDRVNITMIPVGDGITMVQKI